MEKEITEVYCGNGRGKTTLAIGQALRASSQGKSVIIIQFLKGNERRELDFLEELDQLDIKIFRFEKMESCYDQLNEEEQAEEERNILNGLNFARKVIATQECDFLVLDEILGLLDKHIATVDTYGKSGRPWHFGLCGQCDYHYHSWKRAELMIRMNRRK